MSDDVEAATGATPVSDERLAELAAIKDNDEDTRMARELQTSRAKLQAIIEAIDHRATPGTGRYALCSTCGGVGCGCDEVAALEAIRTIASAPRSDRFPNELERKVADLERQLAEANRVGKLLAAELDTVQWAGDNGRGDDTCPSGCYANKPGPHQEGCDLNAALAEARKQGWLP